MSTTFKMKDTFGDDLDVYLQISTGSLYLTVHDGPKRAQAGLTPKKARRLAKALKKAAKEAQA